MKSFISRETLLVLIFQRLNSRKTNSHQINEPYEQMEPYSGKRRDNKRQNINSRIIIR